MSQFYVTFEVQSENRDCEKKGWLIYHTTWMTGRVLEKIRNEIKSGLEGGPWREPLITFFTELTEA